MAPAAGSYTVMIRISAAQAKKELASIKASMKSITGSAAALQGQSIVPAGNPTKITEQAAALELLGPAAKEAARGLNSLSKANTKYAASAVEAAAAHELFDHATKDADKTALKLSAQAKAMAELNLAAKGFGTSTRSAAGGQERLNRAMAGSTMAAAPKTPKGGYMAANLGLGAMEARTGNKSMPNSVDGQIKRTGIEASAANGPLAALTTTTRGYASASRTAATQANRLAAAMSAIGFGAPAARGNMNAATVAATATAAATSAQMGVASGKARSGAKGMGDAFDDASDEILNFDQRMGNSMSSLRSYGASLNWAGRQISMFFTAPIALAGAAAFKWQMDAETAATQLAKVYDGSMSDIETSINGAAPSWNGSPLDQYLTLLGEKMAMTRAETINVAADWAAIGLQGGQLAQATRLTTEAMILGDMDAAQATEALIAVQSQYALAFGDFNTEMERSQRIAEGSVEAMREQEEAGVTLTGVLAQLNMVENQTATKMQDLVLAFSRSAAFARAASVDAEQLAAHVATIVPSTGSAERAGNALKTIYASLGSEKTAKSTQAMEALAVNAGLQADAFTNAEFRARGLGGGIEDIAKAYAQLSGSQRMQWAKDTFGIYQMVRGMQLLEDTAVGVGVEVAANGKSMNMMATQFAALETDGARSMFVLREFGVEGLEAAEVMDTLSSSVGEAREGLSYYQQALERSDPTEIYAQYQSELNRVLESNPHLFKAAMVEIQNGMQKVIVPLLPILLKMIQSIADLAQWFGNLSPQVQKFMAIGLLALAAVGPIAMLVGSLALLASVTGRFVSFGVNVAKSIFGIGSAARDATEGVSRLTRAAGRGGRGGRGGLGGLFGGGRTPRPTGGGGGGGRRGRMSGEDDARRISRMFGGGGGQRKLQTEARETAVSSGAAATALGLVDNELRDVVASAAIASGSLAALNRDVAAAGTAGGAVAGGGRSVQGDADDADKATKGSGGGSAIFLPGRGKKGKGGGLVTPGGTGGTAKSVADLEIPAGLRGATKGLDDVAESAAKAGSAAAEAASPGKVGKLARAAADAGDAAADAASPKKMGRLRSTLSPSSIRTGMTTGQWGGVRGAAKRAAATAGSTPSSIGLRGALRSRSIAAPVAATAPRGLSAASGTLNWSAAALDGLSRSAKGVGDAATTAASPRKLGGLRNLLSRLPGLGRLAGTAATVAPAAGSAAASVAGSVAGAAVGGGKAGKAGGKLGGIANLIMGPIKGLPKLLSGAFKFLPKLLGGIGGKAGGGLVRGLLGAVTKIGPKLLGVISGPIGWAITGVMVLLEVMGVDIIGGILSLFDGLGSRFMEIMNDGGIPILARPFVAAFDMIKNVIMRIPGVVKGIFQQVLDLISGIMKSIYESFSYMNPFARHSPSLVENVTAGMAIVGDEFEAAGRRVSAVMSSAYSDISTFGRATAGLRLRAQDAEHGEQRAKLAEHAPDSVPTFDRMIASQRELQRASDAMTPSIEAQERVVDAAQRAVDNYGDTIERMSRSVELAERRLDTLNDSLDKARESYDRYADATIVGMGAVDDAMFANEMAQKRLQLAMKNAGADDLEKTEDALAKIHGQMDDLRASREALRLGGAGAEILGVYDQQIGGLETERDAIGGGTGQHAEIEKMRLELEKLQSQAEIMDLEASLKFDPLNRQIEQFKDQTEEMPFGQIMAGLQSSGAQVDMYEAQVDSLTASIDRQKDAITAVEDQRYAAQMVLDVEQEKLTGLTDRQTELNDAISAIDDAISESISAIDSYVAAMERAEQAAKALKDAAGGGLGDGYDLGEGIDSSMPGGSYAGPDEGMDIGQMIRDMMGLDGEGGIGGWFSGLWNGIVDWFRNKDWGQIALDIVNGIVDGLFYTVGFLAGALTRLVVEAFKLLGDIWGGLAELTHKIFEGLKNFFTETDWGQIWENLWSGEWWGQVWERTKEIGGQIWNGLLEGIKAAATGVWNWIWDHVVTPLIDGFKKGFGIESPATEMIPLGRDVLLGFLQGILDNVWQALQWAAGFVWELIQNIGSGIAEIWNTGVEIVTMLLEGIWETQVKIWTWALGLGGELIEKVKEGLGNLWEIGKAVIDGIWSGISDFATGLWDNVKGFGGSIIDKLREGVDAHSPSRLAMVVGQDVGEGVEIGLLGSRRDVERAASALAASALPSMGTIAGPTVAPASAPAPVAGPVAIENPLAGMDTETSTVMAGVDAAIAGTARTTADEYTATMGLMRATDLMDQQTYSLATTATEAARASAISTSTANMATVVAAQTANMGSVVTAETATMATNSVSSATSMATGVVSAGTSMATGMISAGANMEAGLAASMNRMSTNVSDVIKGQVTPVINSMDPMLQTMTGWFDSATSNVGTIWAGIEPRTKDPARVVINDVYDTGLRGAWNNFNEFLDLPALPSFRASFATGGVMPGYTPGRDVHQFTSPTGGQLNLSGGEAIMRPEWTRAVGGPSAVHAMNAAARTGRLQTSSARAESRSSAFHAGGIMSFAGGGVVGAMTRIVQMKYPQLTMTSGLRNSNDNHGRGLAADFSNGSGNTPAQLALARDIAKTYPNSMELIYDAPGWAGNIKDGANVGPFGQFYTWAQAGNHQHHVHWAMNTPPTMPFGGGVFLGGSSGAGAGMAIDWGETIKAEFDRSFKDVKDPGFGGIIGQWVPKAMEKARTAQDFLGDKAEEMGAFMGTINDADGLVERWRPMVKAALVRNGWEPSLRNQNIMLAQIKSESSGIPDNVQSVIDINTGGNEAVGLLQIAKGTWPGVRDPMLPDDRTDPWANMNAALRYYRKNYGEDLSVMWGRGHGYDNGGVLQPTPGGFGTYYNHTGAPEVVLTAEQWRAIYRSASSAPESVAAAAAAAAATAVELLSASAEPWQGAILGKTEAIATAVEAEAAKDPFEIFTKVLDQISEVATKAGSLGQSFMAAQQATADAIAAADERILEQAEAARTEAELAAEAVEEVSAVKDEVEAVKDEVAKVGDAVGVVDDVVTEVEGVTAEVAKVNEDVTAEVAKVGEAVEEVVENTRPELFSEALERLSGEAMALMDTASGNLHEIINEAINSGNLEHGVARVEEALHTHGAEANRIAGETMRLLGSNLEATAAIVGAWVPVTNALYEMFAGIPDAPSRDLGAWATYGTPSNIFESIDVGITALHNTSASLFNLLKDTLPAVLKHSVGIGSKLLNFAAENGDAVAAVVTAVATGNPLAVIPFIPKLLAAALELLPMIIEAVKEIVPALLKGIFNFFQDLLGGGFQTFSYDTVDDAARAVHENTMAIRQGTFVPGGTSASSNIERADSGGQTIVFNGDLSFPNVENGADAKSFMTDVQTLSRRG